MELFDYLMYHSVLLSQEECVLASPRMRAAMDPRLCAAVAALVAAVAAHN